MPVEFHEEARGKLLVIKLTGKLTAQDYAQFVPQVDGAIHRNGKIRLLVQMHDFHGWSVGGLWEDIKFDAKHFSQIERLAMIGDQVWEAGMAVFCKPFTTATIRYFDQADADKAWSWILEGIPEPATV